MNTNGVGGRKGWGSLATCRSYLACVAGIIVTLAIAGGAYAQTSNAIEKVSVTRAASGSTIVTFDLKEAPANPPAGFATATPPRIALDFFDTASALPSNQRAVDDPALRNLQFVQAGNRTRVVFSLNKPQVFDTKVEGNSVVVTLNDSMTAATPTAPSPVQRFAEAGPA
ncbi:MAG TPA: AMIN domain-containing protein, partial [Casimicrobiaceae bacterium]